MDRDQKCLNKHLHYFKLFEISLNVSQKLKDEVFNKLVNSEKFVSIVLSVENNPLDNTFTHHILLKTTPSVVNELIKINIDRKLLIHYILGENDKLLYFR
jgi:hypothetical protein